MESRNSSSSSSRCVGGCGFYGTADKQNMCSKCFDAYLKQETIYETACLSIYDKVGSCDERPSFICVDKTEKVTESDVPASSVSSSNATMKKNRCESCNKKLGLLGFSCRCGKVFCGTHRYADEHCCSFDYKKFGRDVLVKQNPVISADKLDDRL
ncbi:zinc finger A20 and AN1 domain-containing stress-associated protein 9-like [Mercurialis annua]|uniref:zinc finger A20 and AN1 domain-containing stress-associated protein 9-like n=1 Tax=Mercurialis annua TaxID=3986 RepID=UPI00216068D4|nr:zinc finger A20 and AN1 domain-containing stress-associated protein 9-like [Mercurialis annua]